MQPEKTPQNTAPRFAKKIAPSSEVVPETTQSDFAHLFPPDWIEASGATAEAVEVTFDGVDGGGAGMGAFAALAARVAGMREQGMSWRTVGAALGVSHGTAARIGSGWEPREAGLRRVLGLPAWRVRVEVVGGVVPEGSQVVGAVACGSCGRWYVSNHPKRRRCYACSPVRGGQA